MTRSIGDRGGGQEAGHGPAPWAPGAAGRTSSPVRPSARLPGNLPPSSRAGWETGNHAVRLGPLAFRLCRCRRGDWWGSAIRPDNRLSTEDRRTLGETARDVVLDGISSAGLSVPCDRTSMSTGALSDTKFYLEDRVLVKNPISPTFSCPAHG